MNIVGNLIDAWEHFTNTINSRGGTVALLFVFCVLLGFAVMHVMHKGYTGQAAEVLITTFASFTGALLIALTTGNKPPTNGNGNGTANGGH